MTVKPWLTAIHRKKLSLPMQTLIETELLSTKDKILDFGCGHGNDMLLLKNSNYTIAGYDKYIQKYIDINVLKSKYSKITCFYVLNTIENESDRIEVIKTLINLLEDDGAIFIAVRSEYEFKHAKKKNYTQYKDGIITSRNTFQKYFSKSYLKNLLHNNFNNINTYFLKCNKNTLLIKISKKEQI